MKHTLLIAVALCGLVLVPTARAQDLYVGSNTPSNTLDLTNGTNTYANIYIGYLSGSDSNTLSVNNAGTLLTNSGLFYVGYSGSGNSLVISNGGLVAMGTNALIGFSSTSSNNSVLVTGAGSLWTNSSQVRVGSSGSGNTLVISNGGTVANAIGYIGYGADSSNNSALVTGAGSLWTNSGNLRIGHVGNGNSLTISDGGSVANARGYIGFTNVSSNNSVLVAGTGSLWTNSGKLYVGFLGSGNSLTISDGGTVVAASGITIAASNGSSGTLNIGRFGANDTGGTIIAPTIAFGDGTGTINFNQSDAVTITSAISGAGTLNQLGAGTTTLSATNTYTGGATVSAGTLFFSRTTALPTNTAAALVAGSGGTLAFAAGGAGEFDAIQIRELLANLTSATNNNNGLLAGSRFGLSVDSALTLTKPVVDSSGTGGGAIGLTKLGTGTLTLSGANSYSGGTLVSSGELAGDTTSLQGAMTNNALVTFSQATNGTYAGAMSGAGLLTKTGTGTLTLSGANSYSGGTLVSSGELAGDTTSLQGTMTNNALVTFSQTTNGTYAGAMSGAGLLTKTGTGTLTLSGANSYSGGTLVSNGELAGDTRSLQGTMTNNARVTFSQATNGTYAGAMSGAGLLTKTGAGTLTLSGSNTYAGVTTIEGGTLFFSRTTALPTNTAAAWVVGGTLALAAGGVGEFDASQISDLLANLTSVTNNNNGLLAGSRFGLSVDSAWTLTNPVVDSAGTGGGAIGLTKLGTGTLTLSGANTYSGGTLVSSGELAGDTRSLQGAMTNNARVTFGQATNGTYAGAMSGSGLLAKTGAGTLTLSGANTYSGGTLVSSGELAGDTTSLQGEMTNDARVTFSQATNGTYAGAMSGAGLLTKTGTGTLTLSGANSYSGGTLVSSGELAGDTTSLQGAMTNNARVTFDQATNGTYAGAMSGAGWLTKTGAGSLTLIGTNTYSGHTFVNGGALNISGGSQLSNAIGYIGRLTNSTGVATVTGSGSQWNNSSDLYVGLYGTGTLNVEVGGVVSNTVGVIGNAANSTGVATVTGSGSQWNNSSTLNVGNSGTGTLNVEAGGVVSNTLGYIGIQAGSTGVATVTGSGSLWKNSSDLYVGESGTGTLNVEDGGVVSNTVGYIGNQAGSTGVATVTGSGSRWNNSGSLNVGNSGTGRLNVADGGVVAAASGITIALQTGSSGTLNIGRFGTNDTGGTILAPTIAFGNGTGAINFNQSDAVTITSAISGAGTLNQLGSGTTTLSGTNTYSGGTLVSSGELAGDTTSLQGTMTNNARVTFAQTTNGTYAGAMSGAGSLTKTGAGTLTLSGINTYSGHTSVNGGTLNISGGSQLSNASGYIGRYAGSTGVATVTGSGSQWNNSGNLYVGEYGTGTLNVEAGGVVSNSFGVIGRLTNSTGVAKVTGSGSQWNNSGKLYVGNYGTGTLNVEAGGVVSNTVGYIGYQAGSTGVATVTGSGSRWNNSGNLYVGYLGTGTLNVAAGGVVAAASGITIALQAGSSGTLNIGRFGTNDTGGTILAPTIAFGNGTGAINFNQSDAVTITSAISGAGTLNQLGTGTTILTGNNSYTETTTVSAGTMFFSLATALPTNTAAALVVGSGATLAFAAGGTGEFNASQISTLLSNLTSATNNNNGLLAGSRFGLSVDSAWTLTNSVVDSSGTGGGAIGLAKLGAGTLTLSGANSYSGGTLVSSGELDGDTASLQGSITNNARVTFDQTTNGTYAGAMSGAGSLTKTGTGTLTLSGINTYSGHTSVNGGALNISGGSQLSDSIGYIGTSAGSTGVATVTGSGSQWNNSGELRVGDSGTGTLNVAAGGVVSNTIGLIGHFTNSTGVVTVTGSGSQWNNSSDLYVGLYGTGTLNVEAGGVVSNTIGVIGYLATGGTGVATVTGSGSQWNNSGELRVGDSGTGTLNVAAGGVVSNTIGLIGLFTNSTGVVTVTGSGSQWNNSSDLYVGISGTGTLNVAAGGVVAAASGITIALQTGSSGTLNIGRFGTNDTGGTILAPTIAFGNGTGAINFNQSDAVTITSAISGAGTLNQLGTGTTILTGNNSYTETTTVSAGTMFFSLATALPTNTAAALVAGSGATLAFAAGGAGEFDASQISALLGNLTSATNNNNGLLAGSRFGLSVDSAWTLTNPVVDSSGTGGGAIGLTKLGTGTLTLSGANTYSGATMVSGGTLAAGASGSFSINSAVTVDNGGILSLLGTTNGISSLAGAGLVDNGSAANAALTAGGDNTSTTFSGNIIDGGSGTLSVAKTGTGTLTLSGANSYTGVTTVSAGTLFFSRTTALPTNTAAALVAGSGGTLALAAGGVGEFDASQISDLLANLTSATNNNNGLLAGSRFGLSVDSALTLTNPVVDSAGTGGGAIGLTKLGTGTLTLSGANTYSGGTVVSSGELAGDTTSLQGEFTNNAAVTFSQTTNGTYAGAMSGTGSLNKLGAGTLTLSGANSYSGTTIVDGGKLAVTGSISNNSWFRVGYSNSGNSLTISNGGTVASTYGYIGYSNTATNNSVVVSGSNSVWTNSGNLFVGFEGSSNSMVISGGGTVASANGSIGMANNNSVLITGAGSLWTNNAFLGVGNPGSSNSMVISDGGMVANGTAYIGTGPDSSNNSVLVTGSNSVWTNSGDLYVGYGGSSNSLVISNSGGVSVGGNLVISALAGASNNSVSISGGSLIVTNGQINIGAAGSGALNVTGGTVTVKELLATNGTNSVINLNGGTIISEGTTIESDADFIIGDTGSGATFIANGGTHNITTTNTNIFSLLLVGNSGSSNSLVISNSGTVQSSFLILGGSPYSAEPSTTSSNNSVLVTGEGSAWNGLSTVVGFSGSSNSLVISNGGIVVAEDGYLGGLESSSNNTVLVTGAGSLWTNNAIYVGNSGSGNSLVISNAGTVAAGVGHIGYGSSNNTVLVTGAGSLWTDRLGIRVGDSGSGNSLVISNGGKVASAFGDIGFDTNSSNNSVLVTGAGSLWTNRSQGIYVGRRGSGSTLTVADGGIVAVASGITIAASNGASGALNIGRFGTNDTGGTIIAPTIAFGAGTGAINFNQSDAVTITSAISGAGTLNQLGAGTTTLSATNTYTGDTTISAGVLRLANENAAGSGRIIQTALDSLVEFLGSGSMTNEMSVFQYSFDENFEAAGQVTLADAASSMAVADRRTLTGSGSFVGTGGLTKLGAGTLALQASNSFSGPLSVAAGTLQLGSASGAAAGAVASVGVSSGATLLVSQNNQVNNAASVTLSGGTITRGSGVSEVFGNLNLTQASFLDFGAGTAGNLTFGTYQNDETPSALLTVNNFLPGNTLVFGSDLTSTINNTSLFQFSGGFTSAWNDGNSTFTITAVPEPSTYLAATGLVALMLWPLRRRLRRRV